ncbi:uncharacterized protein RCO7_03179 [Rhynchosporium graminicola]|uniref:Uncharacterized protein n=1 Tax=Rhynchosporium graminicola TaxID=2792576 RepID=A0A1E1LHN1_9HELO|nr:uncharacterized protein RCO7_03179 [Rhynchosporium commune]
MAWWRILTVAAILILGNLCLLAQIVNAQQPRNTGRNGTIKATSTTKSSTSGSVTSFFSSITGPNIAVDSYTWSQYIIPITVGTVLVVVNKATNKTTSTTVFHTDYVRNGSTALLTRTDTNSAGTVTQVKSADGQNRNITVTYPTNYFVPAPSLTWTAVLPTVVDNATCCFSLDTLSATPTHTPLVQIGPLDEEDDRGWLYTLMGFKSGDAHTVFNSTGVSSLFAGQKLDIEYDGCPHTYCHLVTSSVSPAEGVQARPGGILATSTTTIDIPDDETTSPEPTSISPTPTFTALPDQEPTRSPDTTPTDTPTPSMPSSSPFITQPRPATNPTSTPLNAQRESTKVSGAPPQNTEEKPTEISEAPGTETTESSPVQQTLPPKPSTASQASQVITIGSSTITANSASQYIIGSQTLAPGSSVTLGSGSSTTLIALQTIGSNTVLVIGDSSSTLSPATKSAGIGGIVCSVFGCDPTMTSSVEEVTGSAAPISVQASTAGILHPSGVLILVLFVICALLL